MKLNWKKYAAACAIGAAMMAPLSACGSAGSSDTTKISFYSYFKENQIGDLVEQFKKDNPDITLDVQYGQDSSQYIQTLQTRLAGGTPPTIFNVTMDNRTDIIDAGAALDIAGESFLDGIDESNFTLFSQDGKTYAMPVSAWVGIMFYNADILADAGYDEFPSTWDEFIDMGKAINESGSTAYLEDFNSQPSGSLIGLLASKYAADGNATQDEVIWNGESTFSEEWTPVVKAWDKAIEAGVIPQQSVGLSADQVKQEFMTGSLAVMRSGPWDLEDLRASGINFKAAAMPAYGDGEQWINGGPDQGFAISSKANEKQQEAAKKFLSFLNSETGLKLFTDQAGTMSISDKYRNEPPAELADIFSEYFNTSKFYWVNWAKAPSVMSSEMSARQQQLVQGKITPADFTKALDEKWSSAAGE